MKKIVIAGGDKRMSCLAELLFNSGYSFASYAVNGGLTKDEFLCYLRENNNILLILPLPVSRDKIHLTPTERSRASNYRKSANVSEKAIR